MEICFDFSRVGKEIKRLRMSKGLTQKELFHGIVSQSAISKIENGDSEMQAKTLFLIAERLETEMNYFYQIAAMEEYEYYVSITDQITAARKKKDYKKLSKLIKNANMRPHFQATREQYQFLLWHESLCTYFENHHYEKALQLLSQALQTTKRLGVNYRENEIQILVSLANIKMDKGEKQEAYQCYKLCLEAIHKLDALRDYQLKTEIFYELAKAKLEDYKYEDCIHYCELGMDWCAEHESLYLLKHFLHFLSLAYEKIGETASANQYQTLAMLLMKI